jgi:hypothetical protein
VDRSESVLGTQSVNAQRVAVRSIAWLGLGDPGAMICISENLTHNKADEHADEHHKHPKAGAGGAVQA